MAASTGSLRALREMNRLRVLEAIREGGTVTRAEIARRTGLARSTVSTLVTELQRSGFVVERENGSRAARTGRPPTVLALDPQANFVLAIHFDHPFVRVAIADADHHILAESTHALDTDTDAADALDTAARLAEELSAEVGVALSALVGAGVAVAGPVDSETSTVAASGILPGWRDVSIAEELSARLGGIHVLVDNDANLGALAETVLGAGRGARELAYVMVSSGVGCGLVLDGRLYRGAGATAGEMGHVLVDEQGPMCRCGNRGCLETYAGGDALVYLLRRSSARSGRRSTATRCLPSRIGS
jgi:predicted NBD/HSP70 family sugar kinase